VKHFGTTRPSIDSSTTSNTETGERRKKKKKKKIDAHQGSFYNDPIKGAKKG
jgi:hypothetical protein